MSPAPATRADVIPARFNSAIASSQANPLAIPPRSSFIPALRQFDRASFGRVELHHRGIRRATGPWPAHRGRAGRRFAAPASRAGPPDRSCSRTPPAPRTSPAQRSRQRNKSSPTRRPGGPPARSQSRMKARSRGRSPRAPLSRAAIRANAASEARLASASRVVYNTILNSEPMCVWRNSNRDGVGRPCRSDRPAMQLASSRNTVIASAPTLGISTRPAAIDDRSPTPVTHRPLPSRRRP